MSNLTFGYLEAVERIEILQKRIDKINGLAIELAAQVPCTCDFTEQGQHLGCPAYRADQLATLTKRFASK